MSFTYLIVDGASEFSGWSDGEIIQSNNAMFERTKLRQPMMVEVWQQDLTIPASKHIPTESLVLPINTPSGNFLCILLFKSQCWSWRMNPKHSTFCRDLLNLLWTNTLKSLSIHLMLIKWLTIMNIISKMGDIKRLLRIWTNRIWTPIGKITIIKSLLSTNAMLSLPAPRDNWEAGHYTIWTIIIIIHTAMFAFTLDLTI